LEISSCAMVNRGCEFGSTSCTSDFNFNNVFFLRRSLVLIRLTILEQRDLVVAVFLT
jgi:hypothetical protein